jgi:hypothetical protein
MDNRFKPGLNLSQAVDNIHTILPVSTSRPIPWIETPQGDRMCPPPPLGRPYLLPVRRTCIIEITLVQNRFFPGQQ